MKTICFHLRFLTFLFFAPVCSHAVGTFVAAPSRTDIIYDARRDILYISSGSAVLRYQLATDTFLTPFQLTGTLMGMDLSPDGNRLVVADSSTASSRVWVHVIDLNTGQATQANFSAGGSENGTFAVAFGGDGAALISSRFAGSGWVPLRRYDPVAGTTNVIASPMQDSMLSASADGATIAIAEHNISSGPVNRYDAALRLITRGTGTSKFNFECAASRDGSLFAVPTYGSTYIYNATLGLVTNIGVYAGAQPVGAAFHPFADALFCPLATTPYVRVYSTTNWATLADLDFGTYFSALSTAPQAFAQGRTRLSPDGSIVFVTVSGGVQYYRHGLNLQLLNRLVVSGNSGPYGTPAPIPYGTNWLARGTNLTIQVPALVETNGIRFQCAGWTGSGSVPAGGSTTSTTFTLQTNSSLTWNWATSQYQLKVAVYGQGAVNTTNAWYSPGAAANLTATPGSNYFFVRWVGDLPICQATNPALNLTMDQPRTLTALFAFVGSTVASLEGDWPGLGNGSAHTGYFPGGLGNSQFTLRWATNFSGLPHPLSQVAIGGGKIFGTGYTYWDSGYLAALYETNGQIAWLTNFGQVVSVNAPTYDSGNVYVQRSYVSNSRLLSFNAAGGPANWAAPFSGIFDAFMGPTIGGGGVYIDGGNSGGLYGYNQTNGAQLFLHRLESVDAWQPTYSNGRLFSWVGGWFREHDPQTGLQLWSTNLTWSWSGGVMNRSAAVANGFAFFTGVSALFGVDLSTRAVAWQVTNTFTGTPAVANGVVYAIAGSNVLACSQSGQYLGSFAADSALAWQPIVTDDVLVVASDSKTYVFDLCTRNVRQTLPVGGFLSLANGVLYVAASAGELHAYSSAPPFRAIVRVVGQVPSRQFLLQWPSLAGRSYNVWLASNLGSPFTCVATNVAATPPFNSYQNTLPGVGAGYYRVEEK